MNDYIEQSSRTDLKDYGIVKERFAVDDNVSRLNHAALGLVTESAEFADAVKKHLYYGKPIDMVNIKEELGDLFFYMAMACRVGGWNFEEIMNQNIDKLKLRFPEGFSEVKAENRDLDAERTLLESN